MTGITKKELDDNSKLLDQLKRIEAIAYNNWISNCVAYGFPKKENGNDMTCWELYDYFKNCDKYDVYIIHAKMG